MKYQGVIFDLDGTAFPLGGERGSPRLKKVIGNAQDKQVKVSAATGRSYGYAKPALVNLGLSDPCVIMGGSAIIDPGTDEVLWGKTLSLSQSDRVLKILESYAPDLSLAVNAVKPSIRLNEFKRNEHSTYIIYALALSPNDSLQLIEDISNLDNVIAHATPSWTKGMVDVHITHAEATKEHAIKELIEILRLDHSEVIGIGDGANDVPIFEAVGYKVAMGNAEGKLKELADEIAPSVQEDGLAYIIEKYFLFE